MDAAEQNHLLPKKKKSETEDDKRFVYISAEFFKVYEFDVSRIGGRELFQGAC